MDGDLLNQKRKLVTNATILAIYLINASHFAAPFLLDFISIELNKFHLGFDLIVRFVVSCFTDTNPWILILSLCPHFFFGSDIETIFGSVKYFLAMIVSGLTTNIITVIICCLINKVYIVLPENHMFASSAPLTLLCLYAYCLLVPVPIGDMTMLGSLCLLCYLIILILRCLFTPWAYFINLLVAVIVDFFVLRFISEEEIPAKAYFSAFVPKRTTLEDPLDQDPNAYSRQREALAQNKDELKGLASSNPI